jgi:hypothetical protein
VVILYKILQLVLEVLDHHQVFLDHQSLIQQEALVLSGPQEVTVRLAPQIGAMVVPEEQEILLAVHILVELAVQVL